MRRAKRACTLLIFFIVNPALAEEYHLKFVSNPNPLEVISGLKWDDSEKTLAPVIQKRQEEKLGPPYFVTLHGRHLNTHSTLLYSNRPIVLTGKREFSIEVDIVAEQNTFEIIEIGDSGSINAKSGVVFFPEWKEFIESLTGPPKKKWSISPGLGVTAISYQQTGLSSFVETALTLKVAGDYTLSDRWDVGVGAYYTVLPITTTQNGLTIRFLGLNLRTGFRILKAEEPWGLSIMGGVYYASTFTNGGFGYRDAQGPQIYPVLSKTFSGSRSAWVYLKYSPIFDGTDFVSLINAEFATGGGYVFKSFNKWGVLAATLDFSYLNLLATGGGNVQSTSYTLGLTFRY